MKRPLPRLALSFSEFADACGVAEGTVRKWAKEHGLPYSRVGGRVLVLVHDAEAWLRENREASDAEVDEAVAGVLGAVVGSSR